MYLLTLTAAYLRRQLAPLLAALAVTLCTAMVIIVISVMGGFLSELKRATHAITGDLVIQGYSEHAGFSHHEGLVEALEADPLVARATPTIRAFGLLRLGQLQQPVQVQGVDFEDFDARGRAGGAAGLERGAGPRAAGGPRVVRLLRWRGARRPRGPSLLPLPARPRPGVRRSTAAGRGRGHRRGDPLAQAARRHRLRLRPELDRPRVHPHGGPAHPRRDPGRLRAGPPPAGRGQRLQERALRGGRQDRDGPAGRAAAGAQDGALRGQHHLRPAGPASAAKRSRCPAA